MLPSPDPDAGLSRLQSGILIAVLSLLAWALLVLLVISILQETLG